MLVVLSLRGGIDGLGLVVPHGDPAYYAARPGMALPGDPDRRDADVRAASGVAALVWLWDSGEMAAVHAVGHARPNRSHFAAMEEIEEADPGSSVRRGWVNRMIGLDATDTPIEAVQMGTPTARRSRRPGADALRPTASRPRSSPALTASRWDARRRAQLSSAPGARLADRSAPRAGGDAGVRHLRRRGMRQRSPTPPRRRGDLGAALQDTAKLIRADVGAEVVAIDYGILGHAQRLRAPGPAAG